VTTPEDFGPRGRPVYGPTEPSSEKTAHRSAPLSSSEIDEVVAVIGRGRRSGTPQVLPDELKTSDWSSILEVVLHLDAVMGWKGAGWKVGAASEEIRRAEGLASPIPGRLYERSVVSSGVTVGDVFINYRNCESEFAFEMGATLDPRPEPYDETEVLGAVSGLVPSIEVGDSVFRDWYDASSYFGICLDNGGGGSLVRGALVRDFQVSDLADARVDLSVNGVPVKTGYGRAAMGSPLTSLTWMVNWLRVRGRALHRGELVSTGTCTGHCFVVPGDVVTADFGRFGLVTVTFE
jgi:2-keto-4-pentenoate hydratase